MSKKEIGTVIVVTDNKNIDTELVSNMLRGALNGIEEASEELDEELECDGECEDCPKYSLKENEEMPDDDLEVIMDDAIFRAEKTVLGTIIMKTDSELLKRVSECDFAVEGCREIFKLIMSCCDEGIAPSFYNVNEMRKKKDSDLATPFLADVILSSAKTAEAVNNALTIVLLASEARRD